MVPESREEWHGWAERHWLPAIVVGATTLLVVATLVRFVKAPYYISDDSALFQHAGWYISQGATLYVDIWDLKPPLIYAVTTALAVFSGGNMAVLHLLSVAVSIVTISAGVALVGVLTHRLTDDGVASMAAAGTIFVVPSVYAYPAAGIRPKYFAFLFATAALLLAVDDRPLASGAAAAACAGFWQLGAPIALLVVAMGWRRGGRVGLGRAIGGGLLVTAAVVLPFVLTGLSIPLFVEVVLAPIYGIERYTVPGRLLRLVFELGYGVLLVPIGVYGWYGAVAADRDRYWWIAVGGGGYTLQIFLEFQGAIEIILLLVFLALAVGLLVADAGSPSRRSAVIGVVLLLAASSGYWAAGPVTPVKDRVANASDEHSTPAYESLPADPEGVPSMQAIYWGKLEPDICHYRLGHKQKHFVQVTGGTLAKSTCGRWPFGERPAEWLLDHSSSAVVTFA